LRTINHLTFKKPVLIGHKIKLEFVKVSREDFEQKRANIIAPSSKLPLPRTASSARDLSCAPRRFRMDGHAAQLGSTVVAAAAIHPDLDLAEMRPGTQIVVPRLKRSVPRGLEPLGSAPGSKSLERGKACSIFWRSRP